ncbi:MAG: M24 family metallopeptidase, partial [Ruminiclostridium sp.]
MDYFRVQKVAKDTIEYIKTVIEQDMSLLEIRRLCEEFMIEKGVTSFWYWDIGAFIFGGNETTLSASGREYTTSDIKIKENDIITIDLSPQYNNIWGDYARTIVIENGKVINNVSEIMNAEWNAGLQMENSLHEKLLHIAKPNMLFEELSYEINKFIEEHGYLNLDFLGNLGHSIVKDKNDRVYIEKGNTKKLSEVTMFTFEPHISKKNSMYGSQN